MTETISNVEDMRDILHEFVIDSREMVEDIEPVLVELEETYDEEQINTIFRCFHSIKGGAGFLNLNNIQKLTHSAETLLDLFRKGKLAFNSEHLDMMVLVCDHIIKMLSQVDDSLTDEGFETDNDTLISSVEDLIEGKSTAPSKEIKLEDETDSFASEKEPEKEPSEGSIEIPITDEMVKQFVQEAENGFEKIEEIMLIIEKFGFDQKLLDDAYRTIHSFKGNCGFMNYKDLERISHKIETVFDGMKNKEVPTVEDNVSILINVIDIVRGTVQQIGKDGSHKVQGCPAILELIATIIPPSLGKEDSEPQKPAAVAEDLKPSEKSQPEEVPEPQVAEKMEKVAEESAAVSKTIQTDIRVNLQKVDMVINLVGELMIVSQMITGNMESDADRNNRTSRQLNSLITELQDVAMSIRMIPLAGSFRKMVRLVRDLSKKSGKKVQFETRGEDTELDKTVVEQISDPLVHLVRNAIDHGIEPPDERLANGKSETGKLVIEAKYEGNEVWINIIDDGRGLSRDKILKKGIERNLVTAEETKEWSDSKVFRLIFEPGFSTAEKVTSVSGRGVGMDVVKKNIEKVKGHVDITSIPGQGSTLGLRIPLTLAIIDGMLLRVGDAVYTVPLLAIKESIQVNSSQITMVGEREVVMIREQLIPVYRLHQLHNVTSQYTNLEDGILIVLEHQDEVFGLFVDELLGQYQTVIKGLSEYLGKIAGVAGCSILGNGEVSLILDVADLRKEIGL